VGESLTTGLSSYPPEDKPRRAALPHSVAVAMPGGVRIASEELARGIEAARGSGLIGDENELSEVAEAG
jgi:hypothetical protein